MLKVFSRLLDEDAAAGKLPQRILDAGCGVGVIGICAAATISAALPDGQDGLLVRCQDRDELARLVTLHNAAQNGISPSLLEAYTEPLLAGPPETAVPENGRRQGRWDFILTNIPAKAGKPVLEDFVRRSAGLLNPGGRVVMVAVQPLADFFRGQIRAYAELIREEQGSGHCVLVYGQTETEPATPLHTGTPLQNGEGFLERYPFYARAAVNCTIENIPVQLATIHGVSGFDQPGGGAIAAAKLAAKGGILGDIATVGGGHLLFHEPEQGFFPCWLLEFLRSQNRLPPALRAVLSGRNILSLEAARHNVAKNNPALHCQAVPAADLQDAGAALLAAADNQPYSMIAAFPELLPGRSQAGGGKNAADAGQLASLWESLPPLLAPGGLFIAAFSSAEAERFDRKKPAGFIRQGTIKKNGFRALAYRHVI